ncbi:ABC transporter substrate-binding protein [Arthrobacter sp. A2-55]|uniref:ABC transporter substrate-binding protein n=1 Tax=Arthrobacter sp. A2-55 TaxID=2897337 RepID=UPI0021CD5060|nr:ABC transporter substrate-binding protein [Arthrobacter sp. A2-55]MCU6480428.1 ABC transporter substrate-binding protein [Arthrobacter sp. A2-55]
MIQRGITLKKGVLAGVAILALSLSACGLPGDKGSSSKDTSGPIKIAVIDAQSGQTSSLGAWELKGVQLAFNEANSAGGINGRKIDLKIYDDQGDPTTATNLAHKVASDGNIFVMGSSGSAPTLAMAPVLAQQKIPFMSSGQSPKLGELGNKFLFLNDPTSVTGDETLAKYLVTTKHYQKIAMISNNGAYGSGEHDAFTAALKQLGVTPVADQMVTPAQKDFSAALTTIRQSQPEVLFVGAEEVQTGLIVKQARQLGINAVVAGGAPAGTSVYISTAGASLAEGTITSSPYLGNDTNAATKKFAAAYKAAYNEVAEFHGAKAYDGAKILIAALTKNPTATGAALADAVRAVKYQGLVGNFDFDANGVGVHTAQIGVVKNGIIVPAP